MTGRTYKYIIIGGGLAGGSAVEGIREIDKNGTILLIGTENHLPYNRPPLSKKLWTGQKKVEDIFLENEQFYLDNNVELQLGVRVISIDRGGKTITSNQGNTYSYEKLLLATGGTPRRLEISGGETEGILYYRYLDDYLKLRQDASEGKSAVLIGGGFIGSEMAAALNINKLQVTMIFPEPYLVQRVFPEGLGLSIQEDYIRRGIKILSGDMPRSLEKRGGKYVVQTDNGESVESDIVIAGIGIKPSVELAEAGGLSTDNGIVVDEYLCTSDPNIYAAGDNAYFPYQALERRKRIEHWDNALNQGKHAGRNMAGAQEQFTYMPYFFSDLFDFGYEAVGEIDSRLETFADWQKENDTGVIYYLEDGRVRGAMMCNVWDKTDDACDLIRKGEPVTAEDLRGAIS